MMRFSHSCLSSLLLLAVFRIGSCIHSSEEWQPLAFGSADNHGIDGYLEHGNYEQEVLQNAPSSDQCGLYKIGFTQDLYFQYVHYKTIIPDLKEFTLCYWAKFTNHSNDHPIFSYAVDGQPKAIIARITNTERSSYFTLTVEGHNFYRLNYPLRLNRWYHTCQSWNSKTGEWQIWVNAERVGRGFNNRLVGHVIPHGGIAITGQEQSQVGGGFLEGDDAPKGSGGMLGEITMLQLYSVALTAGKAHRDHKHHHAHKYDHDGNAITTPAPTTPRTRSQVAQHPLLTGGQINRNVLINFAAQQQPQIVPGQTYNAQYVNGQFVNDLLSQQYAAGSRGPQQFLPQNQNAQQPQLIQVPQQSPAQPLAPGYPGVASFSTQQFSAPSYSQSTLLNPANVQYIDDTRGLYKRSNSDEATASEVKFGDKIVAKREARPKKQNKRELVLAGGTIVEDGIIGNTNYFSSESLLNGLAGIGDNQPIQQQQKEDYDREPAEAEVKAVMNVCSGCDPEPFDKALVFGWRTVHKKVYSGAYFIPAVPQCRVF